MLVKNHPKPLLTSGKHSSGGLLMNILPEHSLSSCNKKVVESMWVKLCQLDPKLWSNRNDRDPTMLTLLSSLEVRSSKCGSALAKQNFAVAGHLDHQRARLTSVFLSSMQAVKIFTWEPHLSRSQDGSTPRWPMQFHRRSHLGVPPVLSSGQCVLRCRRERDLLLVMVASQAHAVPCFKALSNRHGRTAVCGSSVPSGSMGWCATRWHNCAYPGLYHHSSRAGSWSQPPELCLTEALLNWPPSCAFNISCSMFKKCHPPVLQVPATYCQHLVKTTPTPCVVNRTPCKGDVPVPAGLAAGPQPTAMSVGHFQCTGWD